MNLLAKGTTNAKTVKNKLTTYIMYLAPFNVSGTNVCPKASLGCRISCLFTAGMGVFSNVMNARIAKTKFYIQKRAEFCQQLVTELTKVSKKGGVKCAVRLNGTSDLDFVSIIKNRIGIDILELQNIHYYDYTKLLGKALKYKDVPNYTITFSRSENNEKECIEALSNGINVAVVFDHRKPLPKSYLGYKVVDGDLADDIMLNKKGVILGLKAKGKAKKDTTGFVVRLDS